MSEAGLQGRLADFTLQEILQLIALQQKTGLLTVHSSYPMFLAFEMGMLVGYRDRRRSGGDPLEGFLKSYGFFPSDTWEHIDFVAHNSKLDLTEILVNESLMSAEELERIQQEATQEDIYNGMQLEDGRYNFVPGRDAIAALKGRVRMKVDGLLMEAVRRIDESGQIRERFPSSTTRVRPTGHEPESLQMSDAQRRVLNLLGEGSTVGEIVAQARMSEFDTLQTLDELRASNLLLPQILEAPAIATSNEDDDRPLEDLGVSVATLSGSAAFVLLVVVLLLLVQPWSTYRDRDTASAERGQIREDALDHQRLQAALQLARDDEGRYPTSLAHLKGTSWLEEKSLDELRGQVELRLVDGERDFELTTKSASQPAEP
jgi:Domain of unknown function (DUF4388)